MSVFLSFSFFFFVSFHVSLGIACYCLYMYIMYYTVLCIVGYLVS